MASNPDIRRRWFGGIFLGIAVLMLIAGETVLRGRLSPLGFLIFWMACFFSTFLAILVALLDIYAVRRRTRDEQRALFEETLKEVARQKELKSQRPEDDGG